MVTYGELARWMFNHPIEYLLICIIEAFLIFFLVNAVDILYNRLKGREMEVL